MRSRLPDQIAEDLRFVTGRLRRRLRAELAGDGLPYPSETMLRRIEQLGPSTTAALARAELITPQAAGTLITRLEAQGFVTRRAARADPVRARAARGAARPAPGGARRGHRRALRGWRAAHHRHRAQAAAHPRGAKDVSGPRVQRASQQAPPTGARDRRERALNKKLHPMFVTLTWSTPCAGITSSRTSSAPPF